MVLRALPLLFLASLLVACGGSDDSESTPPPTNTVETIYISNAAGNSAGLSVTESSASEASCPQGGIELGVTPDTNDNGVIDAAEQSQATSIAVCSAEATRVMYSVQKVTSEACAGNAGVALALSWDANMDSYQGSDEGVGNLALCLDGDSQTVVLKTEKLDDIAGCRSSGYHLKAGLDRNSDNALSNSETMVETTLCATFSYLTVDDVSAEPGEPGKAWSGSVRFSYNSYSATPEVAQASLSNHPDWLQIDEVTDSYVFLSGTPVTAGEFVATLRVERGNYAEEREITVVVQNGGRFTADLVDAEHVRIVSPEAFDVDTEVLFILSRSTRYTYTTGAIRSVILPAGETSVVVDTALRDIGTDGLFSMLNVMIAEVRHPDLERVFRASNNYFVESIEAPIELPAIGDESTAIGCRVTKLRLDTESLSTSTRYCSVRNSSLVQGPAWAELRGSRLYFNELSDNLNAQGTLSVRFTLEDSQSYEVSRDYVVVVPNTDGDELSDDEDAFPEDSRYAVDADADGVADEWELYHFNTLNTITAISDFDSDGVTDKQAFMHDRPLSSFGFDFEAGELPQNWENRDIEGVWTVSDEQASEGRFSLRGNDDATIRFPIDVLASTIDFRIRVEGEGFSYLRWTFAPIDGQGVSSYRNTRSSSTQVDQWAYGEIDVPAGKYNLTLKIYGREETVVYLDQISGFATAISGDEDQDGIPNYLEAYNKDIVITQGDRDGDGVVDEDDLYPDNPDYASDEDNDGLPDEWENQYGRTWYFSTTGDRDNDGVKDIDEFFAGTHPNRYNLTLVDDVVRVSQGGTVTLDLIANDKGAGTVALGEIASLQSGALNYVDGVVSYTAPQDYTGWMTTTYTAFNEYETGTGNLLVYISDAPKPEFSKVVVDAGYAAAALTPEGDLYTWGRNDEGQLGNGSFSQKTIPGKILEEVADVVMSLEFVAALMQDGRVLYWGEGIVTPQETTLPEDITIRQIEIYDRDELLLLANDGTVWKGEFDYLDDTAPSLEDSLPEISMLASGYDHTLALTVDGSVMALGYNYYGSLGIGTNSSHYSEWQSVIKLSEPVVKVFAGANKSYALTDTGALYGWGNNDYNALGDGTNVDRNVPVWIADGIRDVAPGYYNTLILNDAEQAFVTGTRSSGRFGVSCPSGEALCDLGMSATLIAMYNEVAFLSNDDGLIFSGESNYGVAGNGTVTSAFATGSVLFGLESYFSEPGLETFENSASLVNWSNADNRWQVTDTEAAAGGHSLMLQKVVADYGSTSLVFESETLAGDFSFMVKTSTEANYDELTFLIDGEEKLRLSGENDWMSAGPYAVDEGRHTFEWRYTKDGGTAGGEDTIWLDDIEIPLDSDGDGLLDSEDPDPNRI
jgi:hypothetical protein